MVIEHLDITGVLEFISRILLLVANGWIGYLFWKAKKETNIPVIKFDKSSNDDELKKLEAAFQEYKNYLDRNIIPDIVRRQEIEAYIRNLHDRIDALRAFSKGD